VIRQNLSRPGVSTSLGPRGARLTLSRRGPYANLGLPGSGLSWQGRIGGGSGRSATRASGKAVLTESGTASSAKPLEDAGETALKAALDRAQARTPFRSSFDTAPDTLVRYPPALAEKGDTILEGRIGRGGFVVGCLTLMGLLYMLALLHDSPARVLSADAFGIGVLALGAAAVVLIGCRSRSAGVPASLTILGIGLTAWIAPQILVFFLLALLVFPARNHP